VPLVCPPPRTMSGSYPSELATRPGEPGTNVVVSWKGKDLTAEKVVTHFETKGTITQSTPLLSSKT
jgi:hypothetical protein